MTDRSSEERSRFEKWWTAELPGKSWTSADIDNMELSWRTALEDRQGAAPDEVAKDAARRLLAGVKAVIASGVPSEATPSKENAPPVSQCTWFDRPHPEPVTRCEFQQGHEGPCSFEKAAPSPEVQGTPQKETRPKFTNRHGEPCSQACYEGRHAECTEDFVTCNCMFRGEHKRPHAYATFVAVQKLHHWHDWGKDNEGMVVSSESVWAIWKARDACAELLGEKP